MDQPQGEEVPSLVSVTSVAQALLLNPHEIPPGVHVLRDGGGVLDVGPGSVGLHSDTESEGPEDEEDGHAGSSNELHPHAFGART